MPVVRPPFPAPEPGKGSKLLDGALKAELGNLWFPGVEKIFNTGVVSNVKDFIEKAKTPESSEQLIKEAEKRDRTLGQRIKDRFKQLHQKLVTSPYALLTTPGIIAQALSKEDTPLKRGLGYVKDELTKETPEDSIKRQQQEFTQEMLQLARKGIPEQIQRVQQEQNTPYLERAFGQFGGPVAGALGGTLLSQLADQPGSQYSSGEFQSTSPLSGQLLGSLLGSLAAQGAPKAYQYGQEYGPQVASYLQQQGSRGLEQGKSTLDYLRGLLPQ